jgi:hypothetical protein
MIELNQQVLPTFLRPDGFPSSLRRFNSFRLDARLALFVFVGVDCGRDE